MAKERRTVEMLWISFMESIFEGVDASTIQIMEAKKAFYAGAFAVFTEQMNTLDTESDEATEGDLEWMDEIYREMESFLFPQLRAGRK